MSKPKTGVELRTGLLYYRMKKAEARPRAEDRCVCPASAPNTPPQESATIPLAAGDIVLAEEKLDAMFYHVAGVHEFPEHTKFTACEHGPLDEDRRPYIPQGMT